MGTERLILQLGSDAWQRRRTFTSPPGIVHQLQHAALDQLPGVKSCSIWPSSTQKTWRPDVFVIATDGPAPLYEKQDDAIRWHDLSQEQFNSFRRLVSYSAHEWAYRCEVQESAELSLMIAHHAFLNPLILSDVQRRRAREGRPRVPVLCFAHGPELAMLAHEANGFELADYPPKFLPLLQEAGIFGDPSGSAGSVDLLAAATTGHAEAFLRLFPNFPVDRVIVSPHGCDQTVFAPTPGRYEQRDQPLAALHTLPSVDGTRGAEAVSRPGGFDAVVVYAGDLSPTSRVDSLLRAARYYEAGEPVVATIIAGIGTDAQRHRLETLAFRNLGLEHVFFVGPVSQSRLAMLFDVADIGVFPAGKDTYGRSMLECMACATPAIAVDAGEHRLLINEAVGMLVPDTDADDELSTSLAIAIAEALNTNWKASKGPIARGFVATNFQPVDQVARLLERVGDVLVR